MYVDVRTYFRFMYLALFRGRDVYHRPTARRTIGLLAFFLLFPLFELFTAICLLLDHVFFPGFRRIELERPLFIVGHPRSGTTYLHKLLAQDDRQFFSIRAWEAFFPSILQKKVMAWVGRVDRKLGGRLKAGIERREQRRTEKFRHIHEMGLFALAEDDRFFLHSFTSQGLLWLIHPCEPGWQFYFDEKVTERDCERVMRFYRACLKRQAYFKGGHRNLLSKSPLASLRVRSLSRYFPGCRFIYTVRDPLEAVPSLLSFGKTFWESNPNIRNADTQQRWLYEGIRETYRHPLASLKEADPATWEIVRHADLLRETAQRVRATYAKLGYTMSQEFENVLERENEKQRSYRSGHPTSLEPFGLTHEQVFEDFKDVFDQCKFDTTSSTT
ncbi:MAG: sulfotransferase [bacterium]